MRFSSLLLLSLPMVLLWGGEVPQEWALSNCPSEVWNALCSGAECGILQVREGEALPIQFATSGELLSSQGVSRDFYMKVQGSTMLFSRDKENWKSFDNFFRGTLIFSLLPYQDEQGVAGKMELSLDFDS